ncbi:MAG: hypothetical protein AB8G96_08450 [Phycisphaerales bacterium]
MPSSHSGTSPKWLGRFAASASAAGLIGGVLTHFIYGDTFFVVEGIGGIVWSPTKTRSAGIPFLTSVLLITGGGAWWAMLVPPFAASCKDCGYARTPAISRRCPECGTPWDEPLPADRRHGAARRTLARVMATALVLTGAWLGIVVPAMAVMVRLAM